MKAILVVLYLAAAAACAAEIYDSRCRPESGGVDVLVAAYSGLFWPVDIAMRLGTAAYDPVAAMKPWGCSKSVGPSP